MVFHFIWMDIEFDHLRRSALTDLWLICDLFRSRAAAQQSYHGVLCILHHNFIKKN